jgi:hypothetical protein
MVARNLYIETTALVVVGEECIDTQQEPIDDTDAVVNGTLVTNGLKPYRRFLTFFICSASCLLVAMASILA